MSLYLTRFSYTPETWARLIGNPEDRRKAAQSYIESVGGKLHGFWYGFGTHDGYNLWEAPDNVSMAAVAMAIAGGGALSSLETTVLTVRDVKRGETVGYAGAWRAERDSSIAILAAGYGDGLPRIAGKSATASGGQPVDPAAAAGVRGPGALEQTALLEPVQRRVDGAFRQLDPLRLFARRLQQRILDAEVLSQIAGPDGVLRIDQVQ